MKRTDNGASNRPARDVCPRTIPYIASTALSRKRVGGVSQLSSAEGSGPLTTEYAIPHPKFRGEPGKTRESPMNNVLYPPSASALGN
ncbi:unannotated protein [freshwater metagenome]|uniref:Unannotated protein n=1 Tax=freshwater metagenome TaxID=449393 RepID=A0A6J6DPK5_9ZZZZ